MKNPGIIKFKAIIKGDKVGRWVDFPYDLKETYGKGNLVPIIATFDGIVYQGSLAKMGGDSAMLLLRSDIRKQVGKDIGDEVNVTVTLDDKPREIEVPEILKTEFTKNKKAKDFFEKLSFSHQREYIKWITEAKKEETKINRAKKTIEMLNKSQKLK